MAVQEAVAEKWKEVTGTPLIEAYGLTETSPAATMNPLDLPAYNGSIGLPISSTEVTLRDDAGRDVPLGKPGEICIRGPQVMAGYWQRQDETDKVIDKDGWFATGDIGVMDERGYIKIVDRKKDMILVSGFNVYPNEIEAVIAMCPGVLECAAVGVPGQEVRRGGQALHRQEGCHADSGNRSGVLPRASHRIQVSRGKSSFAPTCRSPTSARSCAANCATRRRSSRAGADASDASPGSGTSVSRRTWSVDSI